MKNGTHQHTYERCHCCKTNFIYISFNVRKNINKIYCKNCGKYLVRIYKRGYTKGYYKGLKNV